MVKIVLEIEEKEQKSFKDIKALCVDVGIIETVVNATKAEIKSANMLKDKLGIEQKTQIVNNCRNEQNRELADLIASLLK